MTGSLAIDIAGIGIALDSESPDLPIAIDEAVSRFADDAVRPDVRIRARWGDPVEPPADDLLFDSGKGLWRLYRTNGQRRFVFTSPPFGSRPYQMATFTEDFSEGDVVVRREVFGDRLPLYPLHYPLDELLMVHLLARGRGIEVHGCGIVDGNGRATLFAGQSGAGKTTMARLWLGERDVTILSDERVILRREGDAIWMYGTPWHGDGHIVNAGRGQLERVYFLRHAPVNSIAPLSPTESVARLFACGFAPFHDRDGLDFSLAFMEMVAGRCACDELRFVPDHAAVDFVRARG